ncbi:collagenase [Burkholderia oklahomensis]|uniref:collagenase n=1 Tax=Burkholderia oklahomensis TaxID=342113 RepID=UPI0004738B96|nr:collagenase [Burkholderia oklahomensis]AJX35451.1 collagenase family protein [Burkholderia oklahomensis C6786]AOI49235.1 collagenase [Burkholderia oklahomensis C6786]KUY60718.1 collagenase [Burkholderia oklahomensis C6786]MBI0362524.1 collagenase [Burkholderia oklahomensis]SUY26633.1 Microbial collagenase precursor [Burkholderia oklahomensis]
MLITEVSRKTRRWSAVVAVSIITGLVGTAWASTQPTQEKQARMPRLPQNLPLSPEQAEYNLPLSKQDRATLVEPSRQKQPAKRSKRSAPGADCRDMSVMTQYHGAALADYIANLPDYECHYGLFSVDKPLAAQIFNAENVHAVASRFVQDIYRYDASNLILVNLLIYLRSAYYQYEVSGLADPIPDLAVWLRPYILQSLKGDGLHRDALYRENARAPSTANELMKLITNMKDEAYYLPTLKDRIALYTASAANPQAAAPLLQPSAAGGFTGLLTVFFYAHQRSAAQQMLGSDATLPETLDRFVTANRASLSNTSAAYQLADAARETYRFLRYPAQKPRVKKMIQDMLASTSMTGAGSDLWLAAAEAVDYGDSGNCADYGTCDYKKRLTDAVLTHRHACSASVRILAQDMTAPQLQSVCAAVARQDDYFHRMMKTGRKPVAGDRNDTIELVVFDDYENYRKYASVIYGISTDNGGMYLEGDPSAPGNQARFIAHEASWLRPEFKVWNLEHEFTHYLDGRYDMAGDFAASTAKPTVWWIEGVAEYLSRKNDNQESIDAARTGTYRFSDVLGTRYSSSDYVARAYRWGYMATRFMFERHRADVDTIVSRFRTGDYDGYENYVAYIGRRYDNEFVDWARDATTAGEPPLPAKN